MKTYLLPVFAVAVSLAALGCSQPTAKTPPPPSPDAAQSESTKQAVEQFKKQNPNAPASALGMAASRAAQGQNAQSGSARQAP